MLFHSQEKQFYLRFMVGWKKCGFGLKCPRQLGHREAAVPAGGCPVCPSWGSSPALFFRLQDHCAIQLLLQSVHEANDLFNTGAVSVALGLESLDRLKPSSESAGVSRSSKDLAVSLLTVSLPPECEGLLPSLSLPSATGRCWRARRSPAYQSCAGGCCGTR